MHVETLIYRDHAIEVHTEEYPSNPLTEWDTFGTYVCWHRGYRLGHSHRFQTPDDFHEFVADVKPPILIPLYLFDHGGITISTTPFSCPWDSGQIGWAYATRERILEEYNGSRLSKLKRERATALIKVEIETYDQYLRGDVYGFIARSNSSTAEDDEISSCWGFYGTDHRASGLMDHAEADIEAFIREQNGPKPVPLLAHADLI